MAVVIAAVIRFFSVAAQSAMTVQSRSCHIKKVVCLNLFLLVVDRMIAAVVLWAAAAAAIVYIHIFCYGWILNSTVELSFSWLKIDISCILAG